LKNVSALNLRAHFSSYLSSTRHSTPSDQLAAIQSSGVRSNIAIDMFADSDPSIAFANTTTHPEYEIMIWLSQTQSISPVGSESSYTFPIANTNFRLWSGKNPHGQTTFSWLAPVDANLEYINADYSPLLHFLWQNNMLPDSAYLGSVQFGSEIFYSSGVNVTFEASGCDFEVLKNGAQQLAPLQIPKSSNAIGLEVAWLSSGILLFVGALFCC
jgi:xyloglucan-specific endo-beta-1,4-glucanase